MTLASYPINVFSDIYREDFANAHTQVDDYGKEGNWEELLEIISVNSELVNCCRLPIRNYNQSPTLYTPLHYAALGGAPKDIFEKLIEMGASKCLKTVEGEAAYDIAKTKGLDTNILELLKIPDNVQQNLIAIEKMEKGLHSVIKGRVGDLITKNGQALPQLALLFEKARFYYPVPGMYGGFSVFEHEQGIQADSWVRICGGSEQNHLIDREGNVTLLPNDNPM